MIYQKITTSTGRCLLLIRKYEDREGFELWRRKEQCWRYFDNVDSDYFKEFFDLQRSRSFGAYTKIRMTENWHQLLMPVFVYSIFFKSLITSFRVSV